MSTMMNQARSRVPRIAEAAVERARLTVVPRARDAPRGAGAVRDAGVAAAGRRRRRAAVLQHLHAAGVLHRHGDGGPGHRARRRSSRACRWSSTRCATRSGSPSRPRSMGMVPPTSPAFLELSDGKVLGKPVPAAAADSIAINPLPTRKPKNLRPKPVVIEKVKASARHRQASIRRSAARHPRPTADGQVERRPTTSQHGSNGLTHGSGPVPGRQEPPAARAPRDAARSGRCAVPRWSGCGRLPADRDDRLGLRGAALPAPGRRRAGVRRQGQGRGRRHGDPAGQPRHDHRPQRRAARRLGRRADDGRGPDADREARRARSPRSSPAGSTSTTSTCSTRLRKPDTPASSTSPAGSPPPRPRPSWPRSTPRGYKGIDTRRDPVRDLPGRRRRAPTWSAS